MTSIEIKTKWRKNQPCDEIRIGTTRITAPGKYAKVDVSGTNRSAGIFRVNAVNNIRNDEYNLDRYIVLHPYVAEVLGYEPNEESLRKKSITVTVESNISEENIPRCNQVHINSNTNKQDALTEYLKRSNRLIRNTRDYVSLDTLEKITSYSFKNPSKDKIYFRPVDISPDRPSVIINSSTNITISNQSTKQGQSVYTGKKKGKATDSSTKGKSKNKSDETDDDSDNTFDVSEVGEGFDVSPEPPEHTFDDIVGLDDIKNRVSNLTAIEDDNFVSKLENKYGEEIDDLLPDSYTMLMYGPPGCGKTMVANAIANEFQKKFDSQPGNDSVAFISVKGSDILGSLQGQSESRIEAVFQEARNKAGEEGYAILFFDEIETLIPDRNAPDTDGTDSRLTVAFLQEMNNIGDNVMIVGATNLPFSIDSAASRRFKTKLFVRHPDSDALAELWRESLNDIDTDLNNQDFDELGEMSEAFTPSEIDAFLQSEVQSDIVEGMLNNDPVDLDMEYFESKINDMQPRVVEEYISSVDQPDMFSQDQMQGYRELESYIENNRSIVDRDS